MVKRFAQCLREYKWTALVSPVCMIGEVAMEVTIPLVMACLLYTSPSPRDRG